MIQACRRNPLRLTEHCEGSGCCCRSALLEWFAAGSWNAALRASQANHTGLSAQLFASSGAFYSNLEDSQENLKLQEVMSAAEALPCPSESEWLMASNSHLQMSFLMSGASYLSPSPATAQQAGSIATAQSMLDKCREATGKLRALLKGKIPADAGKLQLYLELQVSVTESSCQADTHQHAADCSLCLSLLPRHQQMGLI